MFEGFSQASVDFLWGLRLNNERSWFQAHKEEFQTTVDLPLRALAEEITARMTQEFPKLGLRCKVSRIYRDARRLFGRGPYKEHLWFALRRPNENEGSTPCFYFEIAPEYYSYGMGCYSAPPAFMAKLRARIDRDPAPLEKLARRLNRRKEFRLEGACYKRPKGDPGPLLAPWYNRRQLSISADWNCEDLLFTPQLADQVMDGFRFLAPFYQYLISVAADGEPEGE